MPKRAAEEITETPLPKRVTTEKSETETETATATASSPLDVLVNTASRALVSITKNMQDDAFLVKLLNPRGLATIQDARFVGNNLSPQPVRVLLDQIFQTFAGALDKKQVLYMYLDAVIILRCRKNQNMLQTITCNFHKQELTFVWNLSPKGHIRAYHTKPVLLTAPKNLCQMINTFFPTAISPKLTNKVITDFHLLLKDKTLDGNLIERLLLNIIE